MKRVDLVLNVQKILKAKKIKGKVNMGTKEKKDYKSCVSWRIPGKILDIENKDLIIEGAVEESPKKANRWKLDLSLDLQEQEKLIYF